MNRNWVLGGALGGLLCSQGSPAFVVSRGLGEQPRQAAAQANARSVGQGLCRKLGFAALSVAAVQLGSRQTKARTRRACQAARTSDEDCEVTLDGQVFSAQFEERPCWDETKVCAAAFVSSAKTTCVHPDRQDPYLCGDCPRNPKSAFEGEKVCAAAAFVSSAKSQCVHPERKDPYLCGDCPRNGAKAFAFVSAKSQCVHPERKDPYLCGDCPRNSVV